MTEEQKKHLDQLRKYPITAGGEISEPEKKGTSVLKWLVDKIYNL